MHKLSAETLEEILKNRLKTAEVEVEDQSHLHARHAQAKQHGGGHYKVKIGASCFKGKSKLECHRTVNEALKPEFDSQQIHALSIEIS